MYKVKDLSKKSLNILCRRNFFLHNVKMLEITIDSCQKWDLRTIIDKNNSQCFLD